MEGLVMSHATSIDNHVRPLSSACLKRCGANTDRSEAAPSFVYLKLKTKRTKSIFHFI